MKRGKKESRRPFWLAAFLPMALGLCAATSTSAAGAPPTFEHEIKPLFEKKCVSCHGGDETEAGLELGKLREVIAGGDSGSVVVPGKPDASLLFELVESGDMPPEGMRLSKPELQLVRDWIAQGQFPSAGDSPVRARTISEEERQFWSFVPPVRPAIPAVIDDQETETPVDHFVNRKQRGGGLSMRPKADRRTLIRRLYFDMLGLPPTPQEVAEFTQSMDSEAYEQLVERVLASPHYGQRWGRHWLDVAGWAESSLIVGDFVRPDFWRYRDYVIKSFNEDKPFDRFIIEQVAGDELVDWRDADTFSPDMIEKLVATGFLRSAPDGSDNQLITQTEKRYATQQTAVEVATKALLGLTMNCVRCHDHKYDPILQQDYYGVIAVFQPAYDPENWLPGNVNTFGAGPVRAIPILDRSGREEWRRHCKDVFDEQAELLYQIDYGIENTFRDRFINERLDQFEPERREALRRALRHEERKRSREETALVFAVAKELSIKPGNLRMQYPQMNDRYKAARVRMKEQRVEFNESLPDLIWGLWDVSSKPSPTPLLTRGDYTKPAQAVAPGVIEVLERSGRRQSLEGNQSAVPQSSNLSHKRSLSRSTTGRRLAFSRWLTQPDHPLTARVMVNRIWQYHFGIGIVATPDDFGQRGARPTHPELLDWLAVEFVESGWSIKHMHRLILKSATYKQAGGSVGDRARLSGFPRRRLEAEIIRDRMLAVSGLLDQSSGGESVPSVEHGPGTWIIDPQHAGRYRRSIYITTRRSRQPSILKTFDGPIMETNWPQRTASAVAPQSLILMNHPFVLEVAAALAGRIENCPLEHAADRLAYAWQTVYGREPQPDERELIRRAFGDAPDWEVIAHALLSSSEFLYVD
jgi:mono/diheme cytochrome c family protein